MDWANERYVRLYVRETTTFLRLRWEAQALLPHLLRIVDRAGVLDIGDMEPAKSVTLRLPKWPGEVVAAGIEGLIAKGVVKDKGESLLFPSFLEAQESARSNAERCREYRARRRETVAGREDTTRNVSPATRPDTHAEPSTPSHAEPSTSSASSKRAASLPDGNGVDEDPVKTIFDAGVSILTRAGVKEPAARSLVGKLRKHHGDDGTLKFIRMAANKTEPSAWLAATLKEPTTEEYVPMGRKG